MRCKHGRTNGQDRQCRREAARKRQDADTDLSVTFGSGWSDTGSYSSGSCDSSSTSSSSSSDSSSSGSSSCD